ncbi:hypothetical protein, partial [Streptomyces sp. NPDC054863]
ATELLSKRAAAAKAAAAKEKADLEAREAVAAVLRRFGDDELVSSEVIRRGFEDLRLTRSAPTNPRGPRGERNLR